MYRTWKPFIIHSESDLHSSERIHELYKERSRGSIFIIIAFAFCVLMCLAVAVLLIVSIQAYLWSLFMFVMSAVFLWACKQFHLARISDPILHYLHSPEDFIFTKGELISASFTTSGERRMNRQMLVEGKGKTLEGKELLFFETFSPDIWPFINPGEEENLRPGDDWYSEKGKRKSLPITVHIIYEKKTLDSAMIGIDQHALL